METETLGRLVDGREGFPDPGTPCGSAFSAALSLRFRLRRDFRLRQAYGGPDGGLIVSAATPVATAAAAEITRPVPTKHLRRANNFAGPATSFRNIRGV